MKAYCIFVTVLLAIFTTGQLHGQESDTSAVSKPASIGERKWSFSANVMGYIVPHDQSYISPTFSADHERLHLEARYNYENQRTGSLWAGYNFSVGQKLLLNATPMIGGVFGSTSGIAPGYNVSLNRGKLELSAQGEYVFNVKDRSMSFFYSWTEMTYSPLDWLRAGVVAQRTKVYQTALDVQRGFLVGISYRKLDFSTYVFNAGWTDPTIVLSISVKF